jgi:hypothetical protein
MKKRAGGNKTASSFFYPGFIGRPPPYTHVRCNAFIALLFFPSGELVYNPYDQFSFVRSGTVIIIDPIPP